MLAVKILVTIHKYVLFYPIQNRSALILTVPFCMLPYWKVLIMPDSDIKFSKAI